MKEESLKDDVDPLRATTDAPTQTALLMQSIVRKRRDLTQLVEALDVALRELDVMRRSGVSTSTSENAKCPPQGNTLPGPALPSSDSPNPAQANHKLSARMMDLERIMRECGLSDDPRTDNGFLSRNTTHDVDAVTQPLASEHQRLPSLNSLLNNGDHDTSWNWPLSKTDYERYARQLVMPQVGLQGQRNLNKASVLVVGAGGLGCPAASYLVGAGVGHVGLVDGDRVEISNLHRQILHTVDTVNWLKVDSAVHHLRRLNPCIRITPHHTHLTPTNAIGIFSGYDLVLDCTDHPTSRYLISDAAVLSRIPLVSASALRTEGQLIVLNNPPASAGTASGGPCYRCIFPKPPPAETVTSCGEGGILGPVVGAMGVLQALEAIKLIANGLSATQRVNMGQSNDTQPIRTTMHIFSAYNTQPFRSVKMRSRRSDCAACSSQACISKETLSSGSLDYVQFCGVAAPINLLTSAERVSSADYVRITKSAENKHILIDVRERFLFELYALPGSVNVPFSEVLEWKSTDDAARACQIEEDTTAVYVVCRLGNDSQITVNKLKELGLRTTGRYIGDIVGGLRGWKNEIDETLPNV